MSGVIHAITGLLIVISVVTVWSGCQLLFLDWYRQLLFGLRDDLFNAPVERNVEYRAVERELNSLIRTAHMVNHAFMLPFIVYNLFNPLPGREPKFPRSKHLREVVAEARRLAVVYILLRAPLLVIGYAIMRLLLPRRPWDNGYVTKQAREELRNLSSALQTC